jgi:hypothetical protein
MSASIIKAAAAASVELTLNDDKLVMKASAKPPDDLLAEIKAYKAEIVAHLQSAERFVAAVQTIWPGARVVTEAEKIKDAEREVLTFIRENKARQRAE